jgi:tetratricopeptide (TPR) repeat protein
MGEPKLDLTDNMVNQPGKEILFAHFAANLLKSGELDQAIKVCERGLKKFPTYAQAHYILARCYIRKKLNDEARAELERVLRYDPNHKRAIRDLAGIYFANGFQDLYKEYLMQLFTLDPMNKNVIEETKKLGEYKLWSPVSNETVPPESSIESDSEITDEKENVFVEPEIEKNDEMETDHVFPDKIDLSQFDNVEDDFTTILHGKLEYSGKISQSHLKTDPDLADIAINITEQPDNEDIEGFTPDIGQSLPSPDDPSLNENSISQQISEREEGAINLESVLDTELSEVDVNQKSTADSFEDIQKPTGDVNEEVEKDPEDEDLVNSDDFPDDEEDKFEQPKIISQTLGEILVSQQKYVEAKAVFEALKEKQPDNKSLDLKIEYLDRIIGLEKKG